MIPAEHQLAIKDFVARIKHVHAHCNDNPAEAIKLIRQLAYDAYLRHSDGKHHAGQDEAQESPILHEEVKLEGRYDELDELIQIAKRHRNISHFLHGMIKLKEQAEDTSKHKRDSVSLITVSSALVGQASKLTATAKDAKGNVVLTGNTIQWSTADATYATVNASGNVTGVKPTGITPGPINITAKETESGKTASIAFTVTSNTAVSINPPSSTLPIGDPKHFDATVTNAGTTNVTWSIQEGAAGGTVTAAGDYTAPNTAGTYHLIATSVYDNSKKATAAITVQSGNAGVTIK